MTSAQASGFRGHLDRSDTALVEGWCFDTANPQQPVTLEVYTGDQLVGRVTADRPREDILAAYGVAAAFRFVPERPLTVEQVANVRLVVPQSGFELRMHAPVLKRFRRCVLHIGTEKTGSTALQISLGLNRDALMAQKIFVPRSLAPYARWNNFNHIHLANLAMRPDRYESLREAANIRDEPSLVAFQQLIGTAFAAEVAQAPAECNTLLLSNEHLQSRLISVSEVQTLKTFLEPYCISFEVVICLRAQHEVAESLYGLMKLNGATDIELLPHLPYPPGYLRKPYTNFGYFDYGALLNRWSDVFGEAALRPYLYRKARQADGGIVAYFMRHIGADPSRFIVTGVKNGNVTAEAHALAERLYTALQGKSHPGVGLVREAIRSGLQHAAPGRGIQPTQDMVRDFMALFAATNERVRARWFRTLPALFDVDVTPFPRSREAVVLDVDSASTMMVGILFALEQIFVDFPDSLTALAEQLPRSNSAEEAWSPCKS
jgi:hypothetical protein